MVTVQDEMRKGPWTEQEDLQLVCTVRLFGDRRWDSVAKVSGLRGGDLQIRPQQNRQELPPPVGQLPPPWPQARAHVATRGTPYY